jgi:UTP:GlnB (protein PII) uridylyltransferase
MEIALIDTEGQMAIDVFYLTSDRQKLPADLHQRIERTLREELRSEH